MDHEDRPAAALPEVQRTTSRGGIALVLRPLLRADRSDLADAYDHLSEDSRRRRFFAPPKRLSAALLDHLTDLDFDRRLAIVAELEDDANHRAVGIARWARDPDDHTKAEAAVTVADAWQGQGIGTSLLLALVDLALDRGITCFTADVLWDNSALLESLRDLGAAISPAEPGVAHVELDLPSPRPLRGTALHRLFAASAEAAAD